MIVTVSHVIVEHVSIGRATLDHVVVIVNHVTRSRGRGRHRATLDHVIIRPYPDGRSRDRQSRAFRSRGRANHVVCMIEPIIEATIYFYFPCHFPHCHCRTICFLCVSECVRTSRNRALEFTCAYYTCPNVGTK